MKSFKVNLIKYLKACEIIRLNQLFDWQLHMPLKRSTDHINILDYINK